MLIVYMLNNWNIVKGDLEGVFKEFFKRAILNRSLVETYVCLIELRILGLLV